MLYSEEDIRRLPIETVLQIAHSPRQFAELSQTAKAVLLVLLQQHYNERHNGLSYEMSVLKTGQAKVSVQPR